MSLNEIIKDVQKELNVTTDGVAGLITWGAIYRRIFKKEKEFEPIPSYASLAYSHLGQKEVAGSKSNPLILKWIQSFFSWATDDGELAWCAIFINKMLEETGHTGTKKANAKSFLNWGVPVKLPKKGDIVVFDRGSKAWQGHVGIYWGEENGKILCLGGNQGNRVSIARYSKSKLEGYRRLK